jgi:hypothetical protein
MNEELKKAKKLIREIEDSEDRIQHEIVKWFHNSYCLYNHKPRGLIMSIPNGGRRDKKEAMKLKATGLLAGAADLILIYDGNVLFMEVKTDIGRQSDSQIDFEHRVQDNGLKYYIVRSLEQAKELVLRELIPKK